jgi:hypothetical protein
MPHLPPTLPLSLGPAEFTPEFMGKSTDPVVLKIERYHQ